MPFCHTTQCHALRIEYPFLFHKPPPTSHNHRLCVWLHVGEHNCILLMAIWIHRDSVTRSWGPLSCHSSHCRANNARPHVTRICTQILGAENVPVLPWPPYSADMSPIKHVWDALDWRVRQRVSVPTNIQQLCTAIEEECDNIWQAIINSLINSMRRRCCAVWRKTVAYLCSQSCEIHRFGPNLFI